MIKNRVDIKDFILKIERDFPVNDWKIDGLHLWPILRIRLFFYLVDKIENKLEYKSVENKIRSTTNSKNSIVRRIKGKIRKYQSILNYFIWKFKLPQKEYVFFGSDSHRVNYRKSRFNRYFDVIIENEKLHDKSIYFEYASDLENQYNNENVFKFNEAYKGFSFFKKQNSRTSKSFVGYAEFLLFLKDQELFESFVNSNTEAKLLYWYEKHFSKKIHFFGAVLKKVQPKQIAILCYYTEDIFAMIVAANRANIATLEMQHGPQTHIHLAYGNWTSVPKEGYDLLPRSYWCWDNYSATVLEDWTLKNELYQVKVIGNPWVNYWKNKTEIYKFNNYILYSLQPNPVTHEQLFTPQIIQLIKESKQKWFLRLHPRQMDQIKVIKELLEREEVLHLVNIDDATNEPLPLLLANAKLHLTHFSGTTLEASFLGLKTVLINELGVKSFPHLIENKQAVYIDYRDELFVEKVNEILNHD